MREFERLLGRARGYIEAQPVGAARPAYSRAAYERYARRGLAGFRDWHVASGDAERLVRAGTRMVTLERLARAADLLEAAIADENGVMADRASAEVEECLRVLRQVPLRVRGRKHGASRDEPRAEVRA